MKYNISIFVGLFLAIQAQSTLNIANRSPELKQQINAAFADAKKASYNFFGDEEIEYGASFFLYSYDLALAIIKKGIAAKQKDFYIIDIGAGLGGFQNGLANYLAKSALPDDVNIYLIGLTAQEDVPYSKEKVGKNCTKYLFGNFNAENFDANIPILEQQGLKLRGNIDLAVSHLTLLHTIDPLGILIQIYDNLRPKTGMIFFDVFMVEADLADGKQTDLVSINDILSMSNASFLAPQLPQYTDEHLGSFLIRRSGSNTLQLPFSYGPLKLSTQRMAGKMLKLRASYINQDATKKPLKTKRNPGLKQVYFLGSPGSEELYRWLLENSAELGRKTSQWESIFADDKRIISNP